MCKRSEDKTYMSKHIMDKMWKQWRIKGGKEEGKEDNKEEASLAKPMAKRIKAKARKRTRMIQKIKRRRRLAHAIIVRKRVTLKRTAGRNIQGRYQRSSKKRRIAKTEKVGAALKKKTSIFFPALMLTPKRMLNTNSITILMHSRFLVMTSIMHLLKPRLWKMMWQKHYSQLN